MAENLGSLSSQREKRAIAEQITTWLDGLGLHVADTDVARPWGGFFVIADEDVTHFLELFFGDVAFTLAERQLELRQKILFVAPGKRLSWQYHDRRAEVHRVVAGPVAYAISPTDEQSPPQTYQPSELIRLSQGMRHRLIGLDAWGVVAEIWQHLDPLQPSDEADNHRLQDDFARR